MRKFFAFITAFFFFLYTGAQPPVAEKYFEWFHRGHIIQSPAFEKKGDNIVFVKRFLIPDSGTVIPPAEDKITESFLPKKPNRPGDPVVSLLNTATRHLTLLDYGWDPAFSPGGNRIAYAFQNKPTTERRIFARALIGNDIRMFNIPEKKISTIDGPKAGFLMKPVFIDSLNIAYQTGSAVNGPYAGGIGLNEINLKTKATRVISQPKIQYRLYNLLGDVYPLNKGFAYIVYSPRDSGSGGLALEYEHLLLNDKDTLQNFGIRRFSNLENKFAITDGKIIYLDDNHLVADDTSYISTFHSGVLSDKKPVNFQYQSAYLSPDGKKLLYVTSDQEIFVVNTTDFSKTPLSLPKKELHAIKWSDDASKLAIIQDHSTIPDTDALYLFKIK